MCWPSIISTAGHVPTVRITAPGGLQRAKESLVYVNLIPYSHLSELGTLSPRGVPGSGPPARPEDGTTARG